MNTPDPRTDLVGAIGYLVAQIDEMRAENQRIKILLENRMYGIADIAELLGMAEGSLYKTPWKLPNWGRADSTGSRGIRLWLASTVYAWYARPEDERRAEWDMMGSRERREAMGRAS